jgi:predicted RNA-binding protein with PUA-like domain
MKVEPSVYSIDQLQRDGKTGWEDVRNYQARNFMRDQFAVGDGVLFYHSSGDPSGVAGLAEVCRAAYPDPTAQRKGDDHFDPKSTPENPIWFAVDIRFVRKFARVIPLAELKQTRGLEDMLVVQKGQRLSVMPVTPHEFQIVSRLGAKAAKP